MDALFFFFKIRSTHKALAVSTDVPDFTLKEQITKQRHLLYRDEA